MGSHREDERGHARLRAQEMHAPCTFMFATGTAAHLSQHHGINETAAVRLANC